MSIPWPCPLMLPLDVTQALRQFAHMVAAWPQFCAALLASPQLRDADPELYVRVEQSQQAAGTSGLAPPPSATPAGASVVAPGGPAGPSTTGPGTDQPLPQGQQLPPGQQGPQQINITPDGNSHGSSRFLNLQPADGAASAAAGPAAAEPEAPSATPSGPAANRGGKEVGTSGRTSGVIAAGPGPCAETAPVGPAAASSKGAMPMREGNATGPSGGNTSTGPPGSAAAAVVAAASAAAVHSNTSLSMGMFHIMLPDSVYSLA